MYFNFLILMGFMGFPHCFFHLSIFHFSASPQFVCKGKNLLLHSSVRGILPAVSFIPLLVLSPLIVCQGKPVVPLTAELCCPLRFHRVHRLGGRHRRGHSGQHLRHVGAAQHALPADPAHGAHGPPRRHLETAGLRRLRPQQGEKKRPGESPGGAPEPV